MIDLGTISRRHLILSRYTSDSLDISHANLYRLLAIHEHYSLVRYRLLARSGFSGPDFYGNRLRRRCYRYERLVKKGRDRPIDHERQVGHFCTIYRTRFVIADRTYHLARTIAFREDIFKSTQAIVRNIDQGLDQTS